MPNRIKIALIISFILVSLVLVFWGAYKSKNLIPEEEIISTPNSPIHIPEDASQEFGEKGGESMDAKSLKQELISPLQGQPGTIHKTDEYRIDYVPSPDTFMVEITTPDFEVVKSSVFGWFLAQGFSKNDTCNMKVLFYLNNTAKEYYNQNEQEIIFNPVFDNC